MNHQRVRILRDGKQQSGPVVYWMSRDQRAVDNWALLHAQELAIDGKVPLVVVFCLVTDFLGATLRQYDFMLKGLQEVEASLRKKDIPFTILKGNPGEVVPKYVKEVGGSILVSDFDPLRIKRQWKNHISRGIDIPFVEVDAHNIVPRRYASDKQEYGAYTLRPKIHRLLDEFLQPYPTLMKHMYSDSAFFENNKWSNIYSNLRVDKNVKPVDWIKPGEKAAQRMLRRFIDKRLADYDNVSNNPNVEGQSDLSPYLHFGQISAQRVALEVMKSGAQDSAKKSFLEQMVIRRELADNFCYYNSNYDNTRCFPYWAMVTLRDHLKDKREYIHTIEQFENALTRDPLWNAAQNEMVRRGKMHGYMRMYWAKKILEWTKSPEKAMSIAIYLNDRYELDGRDPNGYAGIAWSIGGVHDRPWKERDIFGKIRYMNYVGAARKFDVDQYINDYS